MEFSWVFIKLVLFGVGLIKLVLKVGIFYLCLKLIENVGFR